MKITKYEHACFVVEENGESLVVDPGGWTTDLVIPDNVVGVIITHEHADHLNKDYLKVITDGNPDATVIAHERIISQVSEFRSKPVVANEGLKVGHFELEFFGGQHATIADSIPLVPNLGVLINGRLYYPGDSFALPTDRQVEVLALPVAAPWMKISEAMDFLTNVKPKLVFPTHDAILSDTGKALADRLMPPIAEKADAEYRRLHKPLEI